MKECRGFVRGSCLLPSANRKSLSSRFQRTFLTVPCGRLELRKGSDQSEGAVTFVSSSMTSDDNELGGGGDDEEEEDPFSPCCSPDLLDLTNDVSG